MIYFFSICVNWEVFLFIIKKHIVDDVPCLTIDLEYYSHLVVLYSVFNEKNDALYKFDNRNSNDSTCYNNPH